MANQKKGADEGVGTSASSSKVGSLLTDLLNDVKQSVAQDLASIDDESDRRAREERERREREEGRKRAEAQQKLIEETRRRNEALSKQRGESERRVLATAPHMRPLTDAPKGPKSAEISVLAQQHASPNKLVLVALVVIGVGIGLGTAFALTPSPRDAGMDVSGAAKAVIAATRKQATAEQKVLMQLEAARTQIADLQKSVGEAEGKYKGLETQLNVLKADFEKTREELAAFKGASSTGTKRPTGTGVPNINSSIFNK